MIGKAVRGAGFGGLQKYLLQDRERVGWTSSRNLLFESHERAALEMRMVASQSRAKKPVYHLSLSTEGAEALSRQEWENAADRVLRRLGLQDHQALVVSHTDQAHHHIHLMVNRVHPETGRAANLGHDYAKIETELRAIERDFGLRAVPGPHAPGPKDRPRSSRPGEYQEARRTGRQPLLESARRRAHPLIREAEHWQDLHRELAHQGFGLEKRGRGGVLLQNGQALKLSRLDRAISLHALEDRLGPYEPPREAFTPAIPRSTKAPRSALSRERHFFESLRALYRAEAASDAARRLSKLARQEGWASVAKKLSEGPEAFGELRRSFELEPQAAPVGRRALQTAVDAAYARSQDATPFFGQERAAIATILRQAPHWQDAHLELTKRGHTLERRSGEVVITNGSFRLRPHQLHRELATTALERRLGGFEPAIEAFDPQVPSRRRSRELGELRRVLERLQSHQAFAIAGGKVQASSGQLQQQVTALVRLRSEHQEALRQTSRRINRGLRALYAPDDLRAARRAIVAVARRDGWGSAAHALIENPRAFGRLRQAHLFGPRAQQLGIRALPELFRDFERFDRLRQLRPELARRVSQGRRIAPLARRAIHRARLLRSALTPRRALEAQAFALATRIGLRAAQAALPAPLLPVLAHAIRNAKRARRLAEKDDRDRGR